MALTPLGRSHTPGLVDQHELGVEHRVPDWRRRRANTTSGSPPDEVRAPCADLALPAGHTEQDAARVSLDSSVYPWTDPA